MTTFGVLAVLQLGVGLTTNLVSGVVSLPGFFGSATGLWSLFGLFALLSLICGLWLRHLDGNIQARTHARLEDSSPRAGSVAVVAGDGSADQRYAIWSMEEFSPDVATVHTAIGRRDRIAPGPTQLESLPPYIQRDYDTALTADIVTAAGGGMHALVVLQGSSSSGKTRSLFEAVRRHCTDFQVIRPLTPAALRALPASGHLARSASVVWLNELQGFLGSNGTGLSRVLLADLFAASPYPLVVVGTLWPEKLRQFTDPSDECNRDTRELLSDNVPEVRWHLVPDRFSESELERARTVASEDTRITDALKDRERFGVTQTLAGAHELLRQYETARPSTRFVLEAAADARLLGVTSALPAPLLEALAFIYWKESRGIVAPPNSWFQDALDQAVEPLRSEDGVRALVPLADSSGYTLADYLEQHLNMARRDRPVNEQVWQVLRDRAPVSDIIEVADAARRHGRAEDEESLLRRACSLGLPASLNLVGSLRRQGRDNEVEAPLRDAVADGVVDAHRDLADWLTKYGRVVEAEQVLLASAARREFRGRRALAYWLTDQGRPDEAEQPLLAAVEDGEPNARAHFAYWLTDQGRLDEAEQYLRAAADATEPSARLALAEWLAQHKDSLEAETPLREAVASGEKDAHGKLARWLIRHGRGEEAEYSLREAVLAREPSASLALSSWLTKNGRILEAEKYLFVAANQGDPVALGRLTKQLSQQGRTSQAEQVLRNAAANGAPFGHHILVDWLVAEGRTHDAEQALRSGISAGEPMQKRLASMLTEQGRGSEVEKVLRDAVAAGNSMAHTDLARWLTDQGRIDEAEPLRRSGYAAGDSFDLGDDVQ